MRLLTGASAVKSTLLIKRVTDQRLQEAWRQHSPKLFDGGDHSRYQPWLALPHSWLDQSNHCELRPLFEFNHRFLSTSELSSFNLFYSRLPKNPLGLEMATFYPDSPTAEALTAFNEAIREAELELVRTQPHYRDLLENLIQGYVPLTDPTQSKNDFGISTVWLKGVVFLNLHQNAPLQRRVENLAHELAHQILIHYQLNDFLIQPLASCSHITSNLLTPTYSGIRNTERPAILALHGAAALSAILETARVQKDPGRERVAHHWLTQTIVGLKKLPLTELGALLLEEVEDAL